MWGFSTVFWTWIKRRQWTNCLPLCVFRWSWTQRQVFLKIIYIHFGIYPPHHPGCQSLLWWHDIFRLRKLASLGWGRSNISSIQKCQTGGTNCWWFRNPKANHRLDGAKIFVNNGINQEPQLVFSPDFWTINSMSLCRMGLNSGIQTKNFLQTTPWNGAPLGINVKTMTIFDIKFMQV